MNVSPLPAICVRIVQLLRSDYVLFVKLAIVLSTALIYTVACTAGGSLGNT